MLPVVVRAIKERRAGLKLLYDFLPHAAEQIHRERILGQSRRNQVGSQPIARRDRTSVVHYFELARRANQAMERALECLHHYLGKQDEGHLDQALRHYEKAERLQRARVKARMDFSPKQNHAVATAC